MGASFTSFEKFGDMLSTMPEEDGKELAYAVMMYGHFGTEPELAYPLSTMFAAIREDIDNSKSAREQGRRGGRPKGSQKRKPAEEETPGSAKEETPGNPDCKTPGSDDPETTGSEVAETPGLGKSETTGLWKAETQTKPDQTKPDQAKGVMKRERFKPPTLHEVAVYAQGYAAQKGLDPGGFDAERFMDYYASNGWKVGRNPMRDWRATVRDWVRRDCKPGGGARDEYSDL